eukprot:GHVS01032847.1.p1 GENE.GHVS01032847.1~~GHVS01032847.1.p1  ORF type:complete len:235 (-),score=26.39 GHVS01032847.1:102-806(-)
MSEVVLEKAGGENMLEIGYWKIRGFAQPIRLLLEYCKLPWRDTRYELQPMEGGQWDRREWTDVKFKLGFDLPNLPWLVDGSLKLTESTAILRHIARKYKPELLGTNIDEMARVEMVTGVLVDYRDTIVGVCYRDTANFRSNLDNWVAKVAPTFLQSFSNYLKNKHFLVGEITVADFLLYELLDQTRLMCQTALDGFDNLKNFINRFEAIDSIAAYKASPEFITRPINNKSAAFQ